MSSKSAEDLDRAVGRLEGYLRSTENLERALQEFERKGYSKDVLINHPMQKHSGRTLVHLAAGNNLNSSLDLLLKHQGDPDSQSNTPDNRQTPLHLATREGYFDCVQTLVEYGGRTDIKNKNRKTAEMLLTNPEHIKKFQSIVAKSKSKRMKTVKNLEEDRRGSVQLTPALDQQHSESQKLLKDSEEISSNGAAPRSDPSKSAGSRYLDQDAPVPNNLTFIKSKKFNLLERIAEEWRTIANVLGLEEHKIRSIKKENDSDYDRVSDVFNVWFKNASGLPNGFPLSWDGLRDILDDSNLSTVADKYFEALRN